MSSRINFSVRAPQRPAAFNPRKALAHGRARARERDRVAAVVEWIVLATFAAAVLALALYWADGWQQFGSAIS